MASGKQVDEVPIVETPMFSSRLTFFFHTPLMDETPSDIFRGARGTRRRVCGLLDGCAGRAVDSDLGDAGVRACCRSGACGYAQLCGRPTWNARLESGSRIAGCRRAPGQDPADAGFRNASSPPITALSSKPLSRSWRSMLYRDRAVRSELVTGLRDGRRRLPCGSQQRDSQSVRSHVCTQRGSELDHCRGLAGGHERLYIGGETVGFVAGRAVHHCYRVQR